MNKLSFFILLVCFTLSLKATHNRAGEITYRQISGFTYEFTVTTYTYAPSPANRDQLYVHWGDNTVSVAPMADGFPIYLPNEYRYNVYQAVHTFPGPGVYEILMEDPNRNYGVLNIPNSVNTIFAIKTTLLINSGVGFNNTPELLNPPIDQAAINHIFIHNPAAYDADGDSISYRLTVCRGENGEPIPGYELPPASDSIYIDHVTGDLVWNTPIDTGTYNIAMDVEEWRKGVKIGNIIRDMQIDVIETDNNPPVNPDIPDFCVEAGDSIHFEINSTDIDNDPIELSLTGGPTNFSNHPATLEINSVGPGFANATFGWQTTCDHVRHQPYLLVLKAVDVVSGDVNLVDITSFRVRVLPNAPELVRANAGVDSITLHWNPQDCGDAAGYNIYRRFDSYDFEPDSCENGVPGYTGYTLIARVNSTDTFYVDDDNGQGLVQGFEYCYRITAYYDDGNESFASNEVCTTLIPGIPPILQVSVEEDDENTGEISLIWARADALDTVPGPYRYEVLRKDPGQDSYNSIEVIETNDLNDTTYTDQNLNTFIYPYTYSVVVYYYDGGWIPVPGNEYAQSLYMNIVSSDNALDLQIQKRAPWINTNYDVYRLNPVSSDFELIGNTSERNYVDTGLVNGVEYTYRLISQGYRPIFGTIYNNSNTSHIVSGIPIDTVPPCPPVLTVNAVCDSAYNLLNWNIENDTCPNDDIIRYKIFYSPTMDGELQLVDSVNDRAITSIRHYPEVTLAGCYVITAVDSFMNESDNSIPVCQDICEYYKLPNVFSPDGDGSFDIYRAYNYNGFIQKVDMTIYNRWGQIVFKTNNPDINWDGRNSTNGKIVTSGVYYYICDVYEPRIIGETVRNLTGFIHVFSGNSNQTIHE
jgi:gliding motility-associated-like protein